MRVVYLSASGQLGGAERCLLDLLACIRTAQPDWSLHVVLGADGPLRERAAALGVASTLVAFPALVARLGESGGSRLATARRLAVAGLGALGYARRLRRVLSGLRPDVVHSNGLKMHVLAGSARPAGARVIWHLHDYLGERAVTRRLLRLRLHGCSAIVANSESVAADARRVLGGRRPIRPVLNGIDLDAFSPQGPALDLDRLAGLPPAADGVVRLGLIATMARWKGHELFLRALSLMPPALAIRAYVIGGPIYQTEGSQRALADLKADAQRLGVADRVGFTGFVDDPAAAMRALDVVVHASTAPEPFGLVVAEAMACGRPVVLSAASGVAERLVPERDALIYPQGDATALAQSLARLASDAGLRAKLGQQARDVAVTAFDRRRVAGAMIALYREVVAA